MLTATSGIASVRESYTAETQELFNLVVNSQSQAEAHLALNLLADNVPERTLVAAVNLREIFEELPTSPFPMSVDEQTLARTTGFDRTMACLGTMLPDGLELAITTAGNLVLDVIVRDGAEKYFLTPIPRKDDFVSPNLVPLLVSSAKPTRTWCVRCSPRAFRMSGFFFSWRVNVSPWCDSRLIFSATLLTGAKSATAAAMITTSAEGNSLSTASCISDAVCTSTRRVLRGD